MNKKSLAVASDLVKYFDFKFIGSVLFFKADILDYSDIDDIDLACNTKEQLAKARLFLNDLGYKDKDVQHYSSEGYKSFYGANLKFEKEDCKVIHLLFDEKFEKVYSLPELVGAKYARKDKVQLVKIISALK